MEPKNTPREEPKGMDADARMRAMIELKRELEFLHARLEYVRLMLKLGARLQ